MATFAAEVFWPSEGTAAAGLSTFAADVAHRLRGASDAVRLTHAVSLLDSDVCLLLLEGPSAAEIAAALDRAAIATDSPLERAEVTLVRELAHQQRPGTPGDGNEDPVISNNR